MKQTVNFNDFVDAFKSANRKNQFSYDGLKAIFEYMKDIDPDYELDIIALCCEFVEYPNWKAIKQDYDISNIKELEKQTTIVCNKENCIVFVNF